MATITAKDPSTVGSLMAGGTHLSLSKSSKDLLIWLNIDTAKKIAFAIVIFLVFGHGIRVILTGFDPCDGLLSNGHFIDNVTWQPLGCMLHKYSSASSSVRRCFRGRNFVVIGDSRMRDLYHAIVKYTGGPAEDSELKAHTDLSYNNAEQRINIKFLWQPEANLTLTEVYYEWAKDPINIPSVIVHGSGTWSMKIQKGEHEEVVEMFSKNLTMMLPFMEKVAEQSPVVWMLQDPVFEENLDAERSMITNVKIYDYNDAATDVLKGSKVKIWKSSRLVAEHFLESSSDGLHLSKDALEKDVIMLMNMFCNDYLAVIDGSCCREMPVPKVSQKLTALFFIACALALITLRRFGKRASPVVDVETGTPVVTYSQNDLLWALTKLGLIMLYFYASDRTVLFMKEQKYYSHTSFFLSMFYVIIIGIFFTTKSSQTVVLNRDQTEEWKGWMQLFILIYHYTGASSVLPIYMHIRILVGMYLFQTGYGHFSFFWSKAKYDLHRLCQVLFRMNLLTFWLCVVMDRPYMHYYFVPLVSFWYTIVYMAMAVWPRVSAQMVTERPWTYGIIVVKFILLITLCTVLFADESFFSKLFSWWPIRELVYYNGGFHEWYFRNVIDRYIVAYGMLFSFTYITLKKYDKLNDKGDGCLIRDKFLAALAVIVAIISIVLFVLYVLRCSDKTTCNLFLPYCSFLPVTGFILLRNLPGFARVRFSSFFSWFGRISLELFIGQYHIWLAADTKGILVVVPQNPLLNMLITSFIFVCVAHEIGNITKILTDFAVPTKFSSLILRIVGFTAILAMIMLEKWWSDIGNV